MTLSGDLVHVRIIDDFENPESQELKSEFLSPAEALLQFIDLLGKHELLAVTITAMEPRPVGLICVTVASSHDDMDKFLAGITCKATTFTGGEETMQPVLDAAQWFVSATGNAVQEVMELMREHQHAAASHNSDSSPSTKHKPAHRGWAGMVVAA